MPRPLLLTQRESGGCGGGGSSSDDKISEFRIRMKEGAVGCCSLLLYKVCVVKEILVDPVSQIQPFDPHDCLSYSRLQSKWCEHW